MTVDVHLVIVGGGFRAVSMVASAPELLAFDLALIEANPRLGGGAYADYTVHSSSLGSRFFAEISREAFGDVLLHPTVQAVASREAPVPLNDVAAAYEVIGAAVAQRIGGGSVMTSTVATSVDIDPEHQRPFTVTTNRTVVRASVCLLATGRREELLPELAPWRDRVVTTSDVISRAARPALRRRLETVRRVVIVGGSHSALSAVEALLDATGGNLDRRVEIILAHRSPIRLQYPSIEAASREYVPGRELACDPKLHVCPATGIVFRDSGLRHRSRDLYIRIWNGDVPGVRTERIASIARYGQNLDSAELIVQATGFKGAAPRVSIRGVDTQLGGRSAPFRTDRSGHLLELFADVPIYALRLEQTPPEERDVGNYGAGSHRRVAAALIAELDSGGGDAAVSENHEDD